MVHLIRLVRGWLKPAAADTSTKAKDTSSMADLVRLLGERDSAGTAETGDERPGNDPARSHH
ncbi:MAG: hypothetical protein E6Q28_16725 [Afipia sp.]|jgi:hypothetical protein|nr:MAG: hypothetical protein E6Q28_16725 [Afipia sp.]